MLIELPLESNVRRPFQISVGLEEGYGTGIKRSVAEVKAIIRLWMKARIERGEKSFACGVFPGALIYGWDTVTAGIIMAEEDIVMVAGDVSPVYCAGYSDEDVEKILYDLASHLSKELKQTRMYVAYRDTIRVYQDDKSTHPTKRQSGVVKN